MTVFFEKTVKETKLLGIIMPQYKFVEVWNKLCCKRKQSGGLFRAGKAKNDKMEL